MTCEARVEQALCFALYDYMCSKYGIDYADEISEFELFPELYLFRENIWKAYWLRDTDRLLVLSFCVAMTK